MRMLLRFLTTRADFQGAARALREAGGGIEFTTPAGEPTSWSDKHRKNVQEMFVQRAVAVFHKNLAKNLQPQAKTAAAEAVREALRPYGFSLTERQALEFIAPRSPRWDEI